VVNARGFLGIWTQIPKVRPNPILGKDLIWICSFACFSRQFRRIRNKITLKLTSLLPGFADEYVVKYPRLGRFILNTVLCMPSKF